MRRLIETLSVPLAGLALCSLVAGPAAGAVATPSERAQELVEALRAEWEAPVVSAAVAVDGEVVFTGATGQAGAAGAPADPRTRFRIASVSKAITGVLLLRLAEAGVVDLDAPVDRYLPDLPEAVREVTARHLLTHTSGVRHYAHGETSHRTEHYDSPLAAITPVLAEGLLFEPGTEYRYTTYGYTLLQAVVEAATGRGFEDALSAFVFEPAGMSRSGLDRAGRESARARGFQRAGTAVQEVPADDVSFKYAGGGMVSTPTDLVRLCTALDAGRLLGRETRSELHEAPFPELDDEQSYGFAVERELTSGLLRLWHPGRGNGFEAYLLCYPEVKVAAAVATNQDWTDPWDQVGRAAETLARLYLPGIYLYRTPPQTLVLRLEELAVTGEVSRLAPAYAAYREEIDGAWGAGLEVHRLAERLTAKGRLAAAGELFAENARAYPESWHSQLALAQSRLRLGDLAGASRAVEAVRPLVPAPEVVAPLAERVAELAKPPAAAPAGRYSLLLEGTGLAEVVPMELRVFEEEAALGGFARSPLVGDLRVLATLAGGNRVWVALSSPHGLVELDLIRGAEGIAGHWQVGFESGPLRGSGPLAAGAAGEEPEGAAAEPVG